MCKLLAQLPGLHGVAHVRGVQQRVRDHLAVLAQHLGPLLAQLRTFKVLRMHLEEQGKLFDHFVVLCDISVEDSLDDASPHSFVFTLLDLGKHVRFRVAEQLEELRAVHVLQGRPVVVHHRDVVPYLHQEGVVEAHVAQVVADGGNRQPELLGLGEEAPRINELEAQGQGVLNVQCVREVVVRVGRVQPLGLHDEVHHDALLADHLDVVGTALESEDDVGRQVDLLVPVGQEGVEELGVQGLLDALRDLLDGVEQVRALVRRRRQHHARRPLAGAGRLGLRGLLGGVPALHPAHHERAVLVRVLVVGVHGLGGERGDGHELCDGLL
mmetsp:Transcript_61428/g.183073  ORF Transcript_61428/g.183073 Transcript_61428/m.183073 type:complete len:326 (-) Transcript_61428:843-1820(-)